MSDDINLSLHGGAEAFTFKYAKELRDKMTDCEKLIWEVLKEKKLGHKFRRQHPYGKYILDFYCHALRLSIEIDGGVHYEHNQMKYDRFRTKELQRNLITELRFTNDEVKISLESVLKQIKIEIKKINLSSAPSP